MADTELLWPGNFVSSCVSWSQWMVYTPFVCNTWLERLPGRLIDDIVYQPNEEFATRYLQNQLILQLLSRYPRMFHLRRCVSVSKFLANLKPKWKPARGRFTVCSEIDNKWEYQRNNFVKDRQCHNEIRISYFLQQHSSFARRFCVTKTLAR
jgi:hypothetical protein